MTTYLVTVDPASVPVKIQADRATLTDGHVLTLYRGGTIVATFNSWLYYTTDEPASP